MSSEARLAPIGVSGRIQKVTALLLFLVLMGASMVFARVATIEMSMLAQFSALLLAGAALIFFSQRCMLTKSEYIEFLVLGLFGLLFTGTAILCNGERVYERIGFAWALLSALAIAVSAVGLHGHCSKPSTADAAQWLKGHRTEIVIVLLYVLACLPNFNLWIKGDSASYYRQMGGLFNWNLSFDESMNSARICGHSAYGFAVLNYPIFLLSGGSLFGLRLCHLMVSGVTIALVPSLLRGLFPSLREHYVCGCTAMFAFSPLVFGLSAEFTVDAYSLYLLVWIALFHLKRLNLLLGAASIIFIFTKEVNAAMLCLYALFALIYEVKKTSIADYVRTGGLTDSILFLIAGGLFVALTYMHRTSAWTVSQQSSGMNGFGVNGLYVATKIKEMMVMNGHWLLLIVAALLILSMRRGGRNTQKKNRCICRGQCVETRAGSCRAGIVGALAAFIAYSLLFVTYVNYRYLQPFMLFVVIGFAALCAQGGHSRRTDIMLLATLAFYVGCNFYTEPITGLLFKNLNAGNGRVITTRTFLEVNDEVSTDESDLKNYLISNSVAYNRQYLGIERCVERLVADVDNGAEITILIPKMFGNVTIRSTFGSALDTETYYWDAKTGNIVVDAEGQGLPELHLVEFDKGEKPPITSMEDTYVLIMPFEDVSGYLKSFDVVDTVYESSGVWRFGLAKVSGGR